MAREFGEDFIRPVDPFTGQSYPGPRMATPANNRPGTGGSAFVTDVGPGETDRPGRPQGMFDQMLGGSRVDGDASKACPTVMYGDSRGDRQAGGIC